MDGHTENLSGRATSASRNPTQKNYQLLGTGLVILALVLLYAFFGSAGNLSSPQWPVYQRYYDMLADGFRAGHLSIAYTPNPELLTAEDPLDMKHYRKWLVDGSFYNGKYYIYWGPVPALFQAAFKELLGINQLIGDQYIVFGSLCLLATSGALLIDRMAAQLFPRLPRVLVLLAMLAFGSANPFLHLAATGGVYQAAILSGQAFMMIGLVLGFEAVRRGQEGEKAQWYLVGAGAAWGLALGCRFNLGLALGLLMLGSVLATSWTGGSDSSFQLKQFFSRGRIRDSLLVGLPVLFSALALLTYNWLRFDDFFEFGNRWMTTSLKFRFSFDYWPANIYSYLLQTFESSGQFPYLHQMTHFGKAALPSWIEYPPGLITAEPVVGLLKAVPISWFGPVALFFAVQAYRKRGSPAFAVRDRLYVAYAVAFLIIATVTGFAALGVFLTTMRYMADFMAGVVLLGILGGFSLYSAAAENKSRISEKLPRLAVAVVFSALALSTIGFGLAFGYQGYNQHFKSFNPTLHEQLVQQFSF